MPDLEDADGRGRLPRQSRKQAHINGAALFADGGELSTLPG